MGRGGRVHAPRDAGGGGRGEGGGRSRGRAAEIANHGAGGGGPSQAAPQLRMRPKAPDIRAKVEPKPHTVLLNCRQFAELPTETEVAEWFGDHLFTGEASLLLGRVAGLDIEERDKRIMVQLGSEQDVELLLTRMGEDGVAWPGFNDPESNEPIKIRGYATDKTTLKVTLMDVPRDVEDETVRGVMEQYGRVEEVKRHHLVKPGMEHITVNRVSVRMTKEKDTELPTTIFGLGSSTSGEDRSMWRVTYAGAPRRCYRCGYANHLARECRRPGLTMSQVEKLPAVGEVGQEEEQGQGSNSFPRSFAAVVKSAKFVEKAAEQMLVTERLKQEKLVRKVQEDRMKADEKADRDAAKLAEQARKKVEAEEKRAASLAKMAETSKVAAEYKEKVKKLAEQARMEEQQARDYEKELEDISEGGGTRKRSAPSPTPSDSLQPAKKHSNTENGGV